MRKRKTKWLFCDAWGVCVGPVGYFITIVKFKGSSKHYLLYKYCTVFCLACGSLCRENIPLNSDCSKFRE